MSKVKLITAIDVNCVIGAVKDGKHIIPWTSKADMAHFKSSTEYHTVIMGSTTVDSLPRLLRNRVTIGVSRTRTGSVSGTDYMLVWKPSLEQAIQFAKTMFPERDIFIAGGSQIYQYAIANNLVDEVIVSVLPIEVDLSKYQDFTYFDLSEISHWDEKVSKIINAGEEFQMRRYTNPRNRNGEADIR